MHLSKDYGVAILKPDGVNTSGVYERLKSKFIEHNLELISEKKTYLSKEDVLSHFTSPFDSEIYSDYLSSGAIIAFLVRGNGATNELRNIKLEFRSIYGYTSKNMKNLLHTTDHGIEFKLQFSLLFPELDIIEYSQYADMAVKLKGEKKEIIRQLNKIDTDTNLKYIGLLCKDVNAVQAAKEFSESDSSKLQILIGYIFNTNWNGKTIELIGFIPQEKGYPQLNPMSMKLNEFLEWLFNNKGLLFLNYLPIEEVTPTLLKYLKGIGLFGVQVYDPRRTLEEAEILEDIVEDDFELFISGGTNGYEETGKTAIGKSEFEQLSSLTQLTTELKG
ncbi:nucleoside-diphosphate kinase [Virgibacillus pantothenticus]|uniref:nucleoside-diphosphate kinase n=1 Tax=Virgibacillus pantothenticus TaxID=1473 RepID=UPI000984D67A|nr:nucleoside-diphosphate kinase [Virgibacillus pantothenticus]